MVGKAPGNFSLESICVVGNDHSKVHSMDKTKSSTNTDCLDAAQMIREEILLKFHLEKNEREDLWGLVSLLEDSTIEGR